MPLFSGEQLEGIIALFAATPHAFAEKDLQTIERIAASLQTAIHEGELAGVHLATGSAEAPR
jgi:putative methionine-R-sulfoxide reductase with GAF domain